jgi:starvation-inducible outer membrane lipoprotein
MRTDGYDEDYIRFSQFCETLLTRNGGRVIAVETADEVTAVAMGNLPVLSSRRSGTP